MHAVVMLHVVSYETSLKAVFFSIYIFTDLHSISKCFIFTWLSPLCSVHWSPSVLGFEVAFFICPTSARSTLRALLMT